MTSTKKSLKSLNLKIFISNLKELNSKLTDMMKVSIQLIGSQKRGLDMISVIRIINMPPNSSNICSQGMKIDTDFNDSDDINLSNNFCQEEIYLFLAGIVKVSIHFKSSKQCNRHKSRLFSHYICNPLPSTHIILPCHRGLKLGTILIESQSNTLRKICV